MSQVVKKLQSGGNSPKTYGHLWVDGIDYGNSEEVYNAFANHARSQGLNQGEFYDQWLTALRNGQDVKFGNGNTVNMRPEGMSEKRAGKRSGWTRFWDDTFDNRRNHFSDAIATARRFTYNAPKPKEEAPKEKADFDTSEIILNYNDDPNKKGHRIWSTGAAENQRAIQRVTDAIAGLKDPDKSDYKFNDTLKAAYQIAVNSGMTPEEYAAAIWGRLQDNTWEGYKNPDNDNDLDWLKAFGIGIGPYQATAGSSTVEDETTVKKEGESDVNTPTVETSATEGGNGTATQVEVDPTANAPKASAHRINYELEQSAPDAEGWITYTIPHIGEYQYNTNHNIATGRPGEQSPAERKRDQELTFIAKPIGDTPLVYEGVNYPIVQEKDSNNYYALQNNMRIKLDQEFVNRWLAGQLNAADYTRLQGRTGEYTQYKKPDGNKVNWFANFFKNIGSGFKTGIEQYSDNRTSSKRKESSDEIRLRKAKEDYSRSLAAGGSKDPTKNRYAKALLDIQQEIESKQTTNTSEKKDGGKIDFNKVNAFSKGGRVVKAQGGLSNWMWNNRNNFTNIPITTTQSTQAITTIPGIFNIATGGSDTSLVTDVIKAQKADQLASDLEVMDNPFNVNTQSFYQGYTKPQLSKPKVKTVKKSVVDEQYSGDPNADSSTVWPSVIKGGLAALDYGVMAWGRKKVHDQLEKGLWDSLYKKTAPRLQGINTATPVEDAQVAQWQQEYSKGLKSVTSDAIANYAMNKDRQASILPQMNQAIRQQSAAALQRQQANQQIANQQAQLDAEAENDFRARLSSLRMSLAQNDASLTTQQAQSLQNLIREGRTKFEEDDSKYKELAYNANLQNITNTADRNWLNTVQSKYSDIWAAWQNEADKSKYGYDFNTWAQNTGRWNDTLEAAYNDNRAGLTRDTLGLYRKKINPGLAYMYRDREGVPARKSGGSLTVKQRNRYKNEPSEDIWINQNKAAHAAVAKFNDNIIKAFLKTLK